MRPADVLAALARTRAQVVATLGGRRRGGTAAVDDMMPEPGDDSAGTGDFRAIGSAFVGEFQRSCALLPHHHVLDVGCGIGRIAIPLTQYLSPEGRYEGFDPVRRAVRHCQRRITSRYPNFRFEWANLYNKSYNPRGRFKDYEYRFPYEDGTFDLVFAASVFTHMLPAGTERYVAESARVLKPGGHFLATFFLLNEPSREAVDGGRSILSLPARFAGYRAQDPDVPEVAVAHEEGFVTRLYDEVGLELSQPPAYGSWSGRPPSGYDGYQDLLVATRKHRSST